VPTTELDSYAPAFVEAAGYPSFLRELEERLVTPTPWFHADLVPYFPCRAKSRAQMRAEAQ